MMSTFYFTVLIALVGGCESQSHPLDSDTSVPGVVAEDTPDSGTPDAHGHEKRKFDYDVVVAMLSPSGANQLLKNMRDLQVPEALPALSEIIQDAKNPDHLRKRAAAVIRRIGNGRAREVLIGALAKTEEPANGDGRSLWSRLVDALADCIERQTEKQLIRDLEHENPHVRCLAATQLGKRKCHKAVDDLIQLLDDKHPNPRLRATWALGEIQDSKGVEELIAIVEKRRTGGNRISAIEAMGKVATPRSLQSLRSVLRTDPEYWIAEKTLKGLTKKTR